MNLFDPFNTKRGKSKLGRMTPELLELLSARKTRFNTTMTTEQRNIVKIFKELERQLGLDLKQVRVVNGKPKINTKHRVVVFK